MIGATLVGTALLGLALFALYYRTRAARPPELIFRRSPLIDQLLASCPILVERFRPPLWGFNRHLQLAFLAWRDARTAPMRFDRTESLTLADGGTVSLEWLGLDDPTTRGDAAPARVEDARAAGRRKSNCPQDGTRSSAVLTRCQRCESTALT